MKKFWYNALGIILPLTFTCILAWGISQRGSLQPPATQAEAATEITPAPESSVTPVPTITLVATQSGQTALDLLRNQHTVDTKDYDFGTFINGIDGVAGDQQHFWSLYHNGNPATIGASQLSLAAGDEVSFVYEKIELE